MVSAGRPAAVVGLLLALCGPASAETDPARAKAEFQRASKLFEAQDYEAALPSFERAVELSGRRASAVLGLAQCERLLGRFDAALLHYREYLASKPRPPDARKVERTVQAVEVERRAARAEAARLETERRAQASPEEPAPIPIGLGEPQSGAATASVGASRVAAPLGSAPPVLAPGPADPAPASSVAEAPGPSFFGSPLFWTIAGVLVAGSGVALAVALAPAPEPYTGNTGVVIRP